LSLVQDITTYIAANTDFVLDTDLFVGAETVDTPSGSIIVREFAGSTRNESGLEERSIQILSSDRGYINAELLLNSVYNIFANSAGFSDDANISGVFFVSSLGLPGLVDRDATGNFVFSSGLLFKMKSPLDIWVDGGDMGDFPVGYPTLTELVEDVEALQVQAGQGFETVEKTISSGLIALESFEKHIRLIGEGDVADVLTGVTGGTAMDEIILWRKAGVAYSIEVSSIAGLHLQRDISFNLDTDYANITLLCTAENVWVEKGVRIESGSWGATKTATVAAGVLTLTGSGFYEIDGASASNDINSIIGLSSGDEVVLAMADVSHALVFKHGVDNISFPGGIDITLDALVERVRFMYNGTYVVEASSRP